MEKIKTEPAELFFLGVSFGFWLVSSILSQGSQGSPSQTALLPENITSKIPLGEPNDYDPRNDSRY